MRRFVLVVWALACEPEPSRSPPEQARKCQSDADCEASEEECLGGLCLVPCDGVCMCCDELYCCEASND